MSEQGYVPQVGDVVDSGQNGVHGGIYLGEQSGRGSGRHIVLGEDGKNCTIVTGGVNPPYGPLTLSGGSSSYYHNATDLAEQGARMLAQICEGLEEPTPVARTATYRTPAASAFGMTSEMAAWWAAARLRMAKVCFVDSWIKIRKAREAIATIERLEGLPSTEMQERVEAAEHELAVRRARVLHVFADQIAVARQQYKVEPEVV